MGTFLSGSCKQGPGKWQHKKRTYQKTQLAGHLAKLQTFVPRDLAVAGELLRSDLLSQKVYCSGMAGTCDFHMSVWSSRAGETPLVRGRS